ncbi:MAG TPA: hypothetical protein VMB75_08900, partial [Rhodocyclaceae bacterium]|nr:hypothetical protein [Rhodocyclaceae bacterium]
MKLARLLVASIALLGAGAPQAEEPAARPARTVSDIVALLDHYQPDPARVAQLRAVLDTPLPATEDRHDLADAHVARARAAQELGAVQRQIAELKAAIEFG